MRSPFQLLEDSFKLITSNLYIYVTYAALFTVFSVAPLLIYGKGSLDFFTNGPDIGTGYFALAFLMSLCTAAVGIAMLKSFSDGAEASFDRSIEFVKTHYVQFLIVCVLYYIAMIIGFILLVIPGILAMFFLMFAPFIVLFEGIGGVGALRKSFEYVKSNGLGILWRVIVIMILSMLVSFVLSLSFFFSVLGGFAGAMIFTTFISVALNCIFGAYLYNMYLDARKAFVSVPEAVPGTTQQAPHETTEQAG